MAVSRISQGTVARIARAFDAIYVPSPERSCCLEAVRLTLKSIRYLCRQTL